MKCLISALLSILAINSSAQNISGLYSGTLTNDSLKMVQNYELALSEYKGKITGYSYITFVSNDTFYYGIKRIKATRENGQLIVEDVAMLVNNYPKRPDKGVHVTNIIPLPAGDSILNLNGTWQTNKTKRFYSIGGDLRLRKDDDSTQSPLISHLKELNIIQYQEEKQNKRDIAKTEIKQKPKEIKPKENFSKEIVALEKEPAKEIVSQKNIAKETKAKETETNIAVKQVEPKPIAGQEVPKQGTQQKEILAPNSIAKETKPKEPETKELVTNQQTEQKIISQPEKPKETKAKIIPAENTANQFKASETVQTKSLQNKAATNQSSTTAIKSNEVIVSEKQKPIVSSVTPEKKKETEVVIKENKEITSPKNTSNPPVPSLTHTTSTTEIKTLTASPETPKSNAGLSAIRERTTNTIQTVTVSADSLILSFYDNGVVDGDSISVFLNDQNIIAKVKLTEAAVKKTVYTTGLNTDEFKLTLVAENLGSLPPNTGLLIIQDGTQRYQIRFSADMQTNASVIIKKKKL